MNKLEELYNKAIKDEEFINKLNSQEQYANLINNVSHHQNILIACVYFGYKMSKELPEVIFSYQASENDIIKIYNI